MPLPVGDRDGRCGGDLRLRFGVASDPRAASHRSHGGQREARALHGVAIPWRGSYGGPVVCRRWRGPGAGLEVLEGGEAAEARILASKGVEEVPLGLIRGVDPIISHAKEGMKHPTNMVIHRDSVLVASQTQRSILAS